MVEGMLGESSGRYVIQGGGKSNLPPPPQKKLL